MYTSPLLSPSKVNCTIEPASGDGLGTDDVVDVVEGIADVVKVVGDVTEVVDDMADAVDDATEVVDDMGDAVDDDRVVVGGAGEVDMTIGVDEVVDREGMADVELTDETEELLDSATHTQKESITQCRSQVLTHAVVCRPVQYHSLPPVGSMTGHTHSSFWPVSCNSSRSLPLVQWRTLQTHHCRKLVEL